jgi:Na+/H+-dicarboxylate symporter
LTTIGKKGRLALDVIDGMNMAILKFVHLVILIAPVGIFGLVASKLGSTGGGQAFVEELFSLGRYAATVIIGLLVHALVALPLILIFLGGRNPLKYISTVSHALVNAFSTASSAATLPLTLEGVEEYAKVRPESARFVLPMGATVNMDGTALYEAVAVIFMAQAHGIDLTVAQQAIIFLTASLAAVGAAAIPEAGLVTMIIVLRAVGLPAEWVGLILSIDWFLDRCRTTVNVWGDCVGAAVIDHLGLAGGADEEPKLTPEEMPEEAEGKIQRTTDNEK